ncbi:unnamed protein product [Nippostrongylus brasiliensis]|uniref:Uncharacterized protein n=1 Tax=Nippostrongylus brasiliensis TaxID=27835 RepID=A0A0N4Y4J9_NIPBR|nr:unnamed protein product [Nippostrongylus brasiliensis]
MRVRGVLFIITIIIIINIINIIIIIIIIIVIIIIIAVVVAMNPEGRVISVRVLKIRSSASHFAVLLLLLLYSMTAEM